MAYSKRRSQIDAIASNSMLQINSSGTAIQSTAITPSSAGIISLPLTPMLVADASSTQSNVTGAGTAYKVLFPNIRLQNGGSNFASGVYTCPAAGYYYVCGSVGIGGIANMTEGLCWIEYKGVKYHSWIGNTNAMRDGNLNVVLTFSHCFFSGAGDTIIIYVMLSNGAGDTADVLGASPPITALSIGCLK